MAYLNSLLEADELREAMNNDINANDRLERKASKIWILWSGWAMFAKHIDLRDPLRSYDDEWYRWTPFLPSTH